METAGETGTTGHWASVEEFLKRHLATMGHNEMKEGAVAIDGPTFWVKLIKWSDVYYHGYVSGYTIFPNYFMYDHIWYRTLEPVAIRHNVNG